MIDLEKHRELKRWMDADSISEKTHANLRLPVELMDHVKKIAMLRNVAHGTNISWASLARKAISEAYPIKKNELKVNK